MFDLKQLREQERQGIIEATVRAYKNPYIFVIPVTNVAKQLCFRQRRIEQLEAERKANGAKGVL